MAKLMNEQEVVDYLKEGGLIRSVFWLRQDRSKQNKGLPGKVPFCKEGCDVLYRVEDVQAFLDKIKPRRAA